eukprot:scaffold99407_cov44-Attheya_sp.AAC.1
METYIAVTLMCQVSCQVSIALCLRLSSFSRGEASVTLSRERAPVTSRTENTSDFSILPAGSYDMYDVPVPCYATLLTRLAWFGGAGHNLICTHYQQ